MQSMIRQLGERVLGVLSGFDRLLFRGILRCVINPRGLNGYLYGARVPMAEFGKHAEQVTGQLIDESLQHARETGREIRYLNDSEISKKDVAAQIAQRDHIDSGLICDLTKAGVGFRRHDNCIYHADDLPAAQRLLDAQLKVSWTTVLGDLGCNGCRCVKE
jgi:hypothetical protein